MIKDQNAMLAPALPRPNVPQVGSAANKINQNNYLATML
jgi:hypothetical protein